MNIAEVCKHVDYTLLRPTATWEEIKQLCDNAVKYGVASVCIPPCYVWRVRRLYDSSELKICTVVGFPLGYQSVAVKVAEATEAVCNGADEIDMVINRCNVKNGFYDSVLEEITEVRRAVVGKPLKVIIECCDLTREEKIQLCHCVTDGKADYIKTSTGFGSSGAAYDDVMLMKLSVGPGVKIKAAGGIRAFEEIAAFIDMGCDRVGCSGLVSAIELYQKKGA